MAKTKKALQKQSDFIDNERKKILAYCYLVSGMALNGDSDKAKSLAAIKIKLLNSDNKLFR